MTDHLTIHCAKAPGDILEVRANSQLIYLDILVSHGDDPTVALNRQSAQELYDLLGEFLADDQR